MGILELGPETVFSDEVRLSFACTKEKQ